MDNPLQGPKNPARLRAQMRDRFADEPWEYYIPQGTPDWAAYGSLPARALTHMVAQPARDVFNAAVHTGDVLQGKAPPSLAQAVNMAGLVAGGGMLPLGPKGALKTGLSGNAESFLQKKYVHNEGTQLTPAADPQHLAAMALHHAKNNEDAANELLTTLYFMGASPYDKKHILTAMDHVRESYKLPPVKETGIDIPTSTTQKPNPSQFEHKEFVYHNGQEVPIYSVPHDAAAAAYHFAGGDKQLAAEALKHMTQYDPEHFGEALHHLHTIDPADFSLMHTLDKSDVDYINSVPEYSPINPWVEIAKLKNGQITELPKHVEKPFTWKNAGKDEEDWAVPEDILSVHPFDTKNPAVIRRALPQAIEPYNWEMSSNSEPALRAWNMYHRPEMLDDPRMIHAQDAGFNLAHPLVKGLDANKWKFVEPEWSRATNNPLRQGALDPYAEAFTDPAPGRGKTMEHALFAADTPIVSNEYTGHYAPASGEGVPGSQNFLLYARANNPAQVYWPSINYGYAYYDRQKMHDLISEMLGQGKDLLAIHGINDLGGTHTQYAIARPEQFRSVNARFDPKFLQFPNLLLSTGSPFGMIGEEPRSEERRAY